MNSSSANRRLCRGQRSNVRRTYGTVRSSKSKASAPKLKRKNDGLQSAAWHKANVRQGLAIVLPKSFFLSCFCLLDPLWGWLGGRRAKNPFGSVRFVFLHHVPAGLGQFASQGFGRQNSVGLGRLAVMKFSAPLIETPRKIGRFHKSPTQIFVAAFGIVLAFAFAIGGAAAVDAATITGVVPGMGKASDVGGFQTDGQRQDDPHPRQGVQNLVAGQPIAHV